MMSKDAEQLEQLTAYVDGELSPEQRAEVERLASEDESVRVLLDELRQTSRLVSELPRGQAPEDLADAVTARLERQALLGESPKPPQRMWTRAVSVAAVFALACTIGWYAWPKLARQDVEKTPLVLAESDSVESTVETMRTRSATPSEESILQRSVSTEGSDESAAVARGEFIERFKQSHSVTDDLGSGMTTKLAAQFPADSLAKVDEAGRASESVAHKGALNFETQLAYRQLTNRDLQNAASESVGNQIRVETSDPASVARLIGEIKRYMSHESIPNAETAMFAEPVAVNQSFYVFRGRSSSGVKRAEIAMAEEQTVVMNIPRYQAEKLIASLQRNAVDNESPLRWTANGYAVPEDGEESVTQEIMRHMAVRSQFGSFDESTRTSIKETEIPGYTIAEDGLLTSEPDKDVGDQNGSAAGSSETESKTGERPLRKKSISAQPPTEDLQGDDTSDRSAGREKDMEKAREIDQTDSDTRKEASGDPARKAERDRRLLGKDKPAGLKQENARADSRKSGVLDSTAGKPTASEKAIHFREKRSVIPRGQAGSGIEPASASVESIPFVTVAISLRSNSKLQVKPRLSSKTIDFKSPTTQKAGSLPPAAKRPTSQTTSQPTSQGTPRG